MADLILIDLPEFGGVKEWRECRAELLTMPPSPEVTEAIIRCDEEIANLEGLEPPTLGERMDYAEGSMVFDE